MLGESKSTVDSPSGEDGRRKLSAPSESTQAKLALSRSLPDLSNQASGGFGEQQATLSYERVQGNKRTNPKPSSVPNPAALLDGWSRPPDWESLNVEDQTAVVQKYVTSKGLSLTVVPISQGASSAGSHANPGSRDKDTRHVSGRPKKLTSEHENARSALGLSSASSVWSTSQQVATVRRHLLDDGGEAPTTDAATEDGGAFDPGA